MSTTQLSSHVTVEFIEKLKVPPQGKDFLKYILKNYEYKAFDNSDFQVTLMKHQFDTTILSKVTSGSIVSIYNYYRTKFVKDKIMIMTKSESQSELSQLRLKVKELEALLQELTQPVE